MKPVSCADGFPRPRLGVSACLLGEPVRYDGVHKKHAFLTGRLAAHVDYLSICPEIGIGMGAPRPPIQLVGDRRRPRALGVDDPTLDVTDALEAFAAASLEKLSAVSGYIWKKHSPTCGLHHVKVFPAPDLDARREGTGIVARAVTNALPLLPVAQEDELADPCRRENFICRVYVYHRWQELQLRGLSAATLRAFHTAHKHLVLSHSGAACERLESHLSGLSAGTLTSVADAYIRELMTALRRPGGRAGHVRALRRLASELETSGDTGQQSKLAPRLAAYQRGDLSLEKIIAALREQLERHSSPVVNAPAYLYPYPDGLRLRHEL